MSPLVFTLLAFGISFVAGLFGSLVGVGGGIIVVPALTLIFGVPIHFAIGASIVSVIATSNGAAASYVKRGIANLRVAMLLEVATASGAIVGALLAGRAQPRVLFVLFGLTLLYVVWSMLRKRTAAQLEIPPDRIADRLRLHGSYFDDSEQKQIHYRVARTPFGFAVSGIAGLLSGLLGIGGGAIKVPAMHLAMGMPLKVCTATSNFMIGVTAAASAMVYFMRGDVSPFIAAPVASGVLLGAMAGSQLMTRLRNNWIKTLFLIVLFFTSGQMLWKGLRP